MFYSILKQLLFRLVFWALPNHDKCCRINKFYFYIEKRNCSIYHFLTWRVIPPFQILQYKNLPVILYFEIVSLIETPEIRLCFLQTLSMMKWLSHSPCLPYRRLPAPLWFYWWSESWPTPGPSHWQESPCISSAQPARENQKLKYKSSPRILKVSSELLVTQILAFQELVIEFCR